MFKATILADPHAFIGPLEAVLNHSEQFPRNALYVARDLVGYGHKPNEVIDRIRRENGIAVPGNHDIAVITGDLKGIPTDNAREAARYNSYQLRWKWGNKRFLNSLPSRHIDNINGIAMVHGCPIQLTPSSSDFPYEREYILQDIDAALAMRAIATTKDYDGVRILIVGHTHVPMFSTYTWNGNGGKLTSFKTGDDIKDGTTFNHTLVQGENLRSIALVNPGAVGKPKGGPRAAYANLILDGNQLTVSYHRVEYDIERTQREMRQIGLTKKHGGFHESLIERLGR